VQILGFALLGGIIWLGFTQQNHEQVVSPFNLHALLMVTVGSAAAVLISSTSSTALRTLLFLRELVPGLRLFSRTTQEMEVEREQIYAMWREGKKSNALSVAEKSRFPAVKQMVDLILNRSPEVASAKVFLELRHDEIAHMQPAVHNWEMLSKLGPAFGMVGTITGMIQLFRNMSADNLNIGAAMSLALLATLYGVAFGAGMAGPIGHYLNNLLDERLGFYERCEKSVNELVARGSA
jgi:chemotaxis protein MotA